MHVRPPLWWWFEGRLALAEVSVAEATERSKPSSSSGESSANRKFEYKSAYVADPERTINSRGTGQCSAVVEGDGAAWPQVPLDGAAGCIHLRQAVNHVRAIVVNFPTPRARCSAGPGVGSALEPVASMTRLRPPAGAFPATMRVLAACRWSPA